MASVLVFCVPHALMSICLDPTHLVTCLLVNNPENLSVSGVTTICLMQCNTSPSHRVDQVFDFGLWNVGSLLFNGCANLLDIGRNWNTLSYTLIQSMDQTCSMIDMSSEYAGHARTRLFSSSRNCGQILATWSRVLSCCNMR